jgi:chromosome segregation ATPase
MSDVSVNTDAGNTYNLASRGFVKAIVSGHDHQTDAHSALFGALNARVANLEHAADIAIKNPTAIEIRDEYGDIISRINADLTVDTPTSTKKLLTTDDYETLTERDDLNTARIKTASEQIATLADAFDHNTAEIENKFLEVNQSLTEMTEEIHATDSRLSDKIDIKIGEMNETLNNHIDKCDTEHDSLINDVETVKSSMNALTERVSNDEVKHDNDIARLEGVITDNVNAIETSISSVDGKFDREIERIDVKVASFDDVITHIDGEVDLLQTNDVLQDERISALQSNVSNLNNSSNAYASRIATLESTDETHSVKINAINVRDNGQDERIEALDNLVSAHSTILGEHAEAINNNEINIERKQDRVDFSTNDFDYNGDRLSLRYGTISPDSNSAVKGSDVYVAVTEQARSISREEAAIVADAVVTDRLSTFTEDTSGAYVEATSGAYVDTLVTPITKAVSGDVASAVNAEFAKFIPTISFVDWED